METRAQRAKWSVDEDGTWLHVLVEDGQAARAFAESAKDKLLRLKLVLWREKRSLSANAYAWTLLGKLSAVLHLPPEEIYWRLIPNVGDNATVLSIAVDALPEFREKWASNGLGWRVELIGASRQPGMVDVAAYYGSSVYNTDQMARLIDLIIQECRENDIEYLPPEKIEAILGDWDARKN